MDFFIESALRCKRTTIHINFFVAILLHVTIRLVIYVDQLIHKQAGDSESNHLSTQIVRPLTSINLLLRNDRILIKIFLFSFRQDGTVSFVLHSSQLHTHVCFFMDACRRHLFEYFAHIFNI